MSLDLTLYESMYKNNYSKLSIIEILILSEICKGNSIFEISQSTGYSEIEIIKRKNVILEKMEMNSWDELFAFAINNRFFI